MLLVAARRLATAADSKRPKQDVLGRVVFGSLVAVTGGLAAWQAQRYYWKCELVESRKRMLAAEPRALESVLEHEPSPSEFTRVVVRGRLDHAHQMLVGPRSPPAGSPPGPEIHSGWLVFTPLHSDTGPSVLVNRGWVPRDRVDELELPRGEVTIEGVVRASEEPGSFALPNDPERGNYFWIDVPGMALDAELFESVPLLVEATSKPGEPGRGFPRTRPTSTLLSFRVEPTMHLVYSGTWATLCVASTVLVAMRFR
ncbi:SURF1 family-domain-containing protein [Pavlovales sp. CCMP2436]|nr:SURF1 family-domain-containing protein [Pavlovales sp. CCMP2436]